MNKVQLSGRMGRDPEVRSTSSGGTITSASLATSNDYKDKSGQWVKKPASWHNIVAFGPVGEALARFRKGDILKVEGKIQYLFRGCSGRSAEKYSAFLTGIPHGGLYNHKNGGSL